MYNTNINMNMNSISSIIVSGPVGVGKSTLINKLTESFNLVNINVVKEFAVTDKGHKELMNRLNGDMSVLEFQKHIIDYYVDNIDKTKLNIIERSADDCYFCFGKIAYENGEMTLSELNELKEYTKKFTITNYVCIMFDTEYQSPEEISDKIINYINTSASSTTPITLLVCLTASSKICYSRILSRGFETYNYKTVRRFCSAYNEYFEDLKKIDIDT